MNITIEDLETIALAAESDDQARRTHLLRMIRAYVRILAAREPEKFTARAKHRGDEAGHWDSSYPPKQEYSEYTGPRSIKIAIMDTEDIATSGGFYFGWRRVTTYGGLYIDRAGRFLRGDESGTGRVGNSPPAPGIAAWTARSTGPACLMRM